MKRPVRTERAVRVPPRYQPVPMSYTILCNTSYEQLAAEVTQFIRDGYMPHGSMVVEPAQQAGEDIFFYQPMIRGGHA